jgi:hypothetical protein
MIFIYIYICVYNYFHFKINHIIIHNMKLKYYLYLSYLEPFEPMNILPSYLHINFDVFFHDLATLFSLVLVNISGAIIY